MYKHTCANIRVQTYMYPYLPQHQYTHTLPHTFAHHDWISISIAHTHIWRLTNKKSQATATAAAKNGEKNRIQHLRIYVYSSNMLIATFNKAQVHELISCTHAHHYSISIFSPHPHVMTHIERVLFVYATVFAAENIRTHVNNANIQIPKSNKALRHTYSLFLWHTHMFSLPITHTHTYVMTHLESDAGCCGWCSR